MIRKSLIKLLNNIKLHNKFLIMYVFCVIVPLVITDAVVFNSIYSRERKSRINELDQTTAKYVSTIDAAIVRNTSIAASISKNQQLNQFLDETYTSLDDYYEAYYNVVSKSFYTSLTYSKNDTVCIYVDNPTIFESSYFKNISKAKGKEWYRRFKESGKDECLLVYYDDTVNPITERQQKFMFVQKMHIYDSKCEKILCIEMNSSDIRDQMLKPSSGFEMYVCNGDYVVFADYGKAIRTIDIDTIEKDRKLSSHRVYTRYGTTLDVYAFSDELLINSVVESNKYIILFLLFATLLLPILIMKLIERSLSSRITILENAFNGSQSDKFQPIGSVEGNDEISALMHNYNNIVSINHDLINTLYKDKLKEQESDLSRKNAELLALQSQINPHFLFNSLESIRMHSILKGEDETAEMVEKLALMTRQNVEWGNDLVTVKKETESIEAYLYLQSYRFGDRLSFDVDVDKSCEDYLIPKLTLVTFVENACVHGIESKSSAGWIFVRVYEKDGDLCMEIEDTGGGMSDEEISNLLSSIETVSIDQIKGKKHVGILNACLRLKLHTNNNVSFSIDSEVGVGMCVLIRIPMKKLHRSK